MDSGLCRAVIRANGSGSGSGSMESPAEFVSGNRRWLTALSPLSRPRVIVTAVWVPALVGVVVMAINTPGPLRRAASTALGAPLPWVAVTEAMALSAFVASALAMMAVSAGSATLARSLAVEVAGAFCNRVTPGSLGGALLRIRYLRCAGLPAERAASAVALMGGAGAVIYLSIVAVASTAASASAHPSLHIPGIGDTPSVLWTFGVSGLVIALGAGWLWRGQRGRTGRARLLARGRLARTALRDLLRDRAALWRLAAGLIAASGARAVSFWCAAHALGLGVGIATAAVVYYAGMAAASAAPVPGGLGPAEVSLTAGLIAVGAAPVSALAAVLAFRVASLWVPSLVGLGALLWLRRSGALSTAVTGAAPDRARTAAPNLGRPAGGLAPDRRDHRVLATWLPAGTIGRMR